MQAIIRTQAPSQHQETLKKAAVDAARQPARAEEFEFETMPIIDLNLYLQSATEESPSEAALAECRKVAECFHNFGILLIRDPRVNM